MSEKLIRCVCGSIYDPGLETGCPACGAKPGAKEPKKPAPKPVPKEPMTPEAITKESAASKQDSVLSPDLIWKAVLLCGLLLGGIFIIHWLGTSHTSVPPTSTPMTSDSKAAVAKTTVDSALVGRWAQDVPNAQGVSRWMITIKKDGTLSFTASGPLSPPPYTAVFEAEGGHWNIHAATNGWTDQGTYKVPGDQTFIMTGKLGTGVWQKQ